MARAVDEARAICPVAERTPGPMPGPIWRYQLMAIRTALVDRCLRRFIRSADCVETVVLDVLIFWHCDHSTPDVRKTRLGDPFPTPQLWRFEKNERDGGILP